jgi:hypothetical protein
VTIRKSNHQYFPTVYSKYTCLDDWTKKNFSSTVNISDEALVLLIIKHYVPKWEKLVAQESGHRVLGSSGSSAGGEEDGKSEDGRSRRAGGAVKGDINTCVKQKACYYEYCNKVHQARSSQYSEKWDARLKEEAIRRMMEQEEKAKAQLSTGNDEEGVEENNISTEAGTSMFVHGMYESDEDREEEEV